MGAVLLSKREKPAWDRRRFQISQAHLLAQVLPALPRADRGSCVREILQRLKLGLESGGPAA